jgi:hypothetical protein
MCTQKPRGTGGGGGGAHGVGGVLFFEIFGNLFGKYFFGVFELPMQRNVQKRNKHYGKSDMEFFSFYTFSTWTPFQKNKLV